MAELISLKNRQNQTFFARLSRGGPRYAVIQHGLTGSIDQAHIKTIESAYRDAGYTTLALDCTNTLNMSDGTLAEVTVQQHCDDLADAMAWLRKEHKPERPVALAGHSMGAFSVLSYAEDRPDEVEHVFASAAMTSGINLMQAWRKHRAADLERWRTQGYFEFTSIVDPTMTGRAPWSMWAEFSSHTVFDRVTNLTMPTHFIVGDADITTPLEFLERFYRQVPEPKTLDVIASADHSYTNPEWRGELSMLIHNFLKNYADA